MTPAVGSKYSQHYQSASIVGVDQTGKPLGTNDLHCTNAYETFVHRSNSSASFLIRVVHLGKAASKTPHYVRQPVKSTMRSSTIRGVTIEYEIWTALPMACQSSIWRSKPLSAFSMPRLLENFTPRGGLIALDGAPCRTLGRNGMLSTLSHSTSLQATPGATQTRDTSILLYCHG